VRESSQCRNDLARKETVIYARSVIRVMLVTGRYCGYDVAACD
jgi:hypothetical protein